MAKKKTKVARPKTLKEWEPIIMQVVPALTQAFMQHREEIRRIEEKKIDMQLKLHEALLKSAENLHLLIEDLRWKSLRDEANAATAAKK
jgi:hypothetical protein